MRHLVPLVMPLSVAITLLIFGYLSKSRHPRLSTVCVISGLLCLLAFSQQRVANYLIHSLEQQYPPVNLNTIEPADVAVLLTGGMELPVSPRVYPELGSRGDRILGAYRLMKADKAPLLIVAGSNSTKTTLLKSESENTRDLLISWGISPDKIQVETESNNTQETARNVSKLLNELSAQRVILITSAYHMPRAMLHFKRLSKEITPFTTNTLITEPSNHSVSTTTESTLDSLSKWDSFIPSATSLEGSTLAIHEYIGIVVAKTFRSHH